MFSTRITRLLAIVGLCVALFGILVLGGTSYSGAYITDIEMTGYSSDDSSAELTNPGAGLSDVDSLGTLFGDGSVGNDPWELQYMYVVSILAVVWVSFRTINEWRFDRQTLALEPRERSLLSTYRHTPTATDEGSRIDG